MPEKLLNSIKMSIGEAVLEILIKTIFYIWHNLTKNSQTELDSIQKWPPLVAVRLRCVSYNKCVLAKVNLPRFRIQNISTHRYGSVCLLNNPLFIGTVMFAYGTTLSFNLIISKWRFENFIQIFVCFFWRCIHVKFNNGSRCLKHETFGADQFVATGFEREMNIVNSFQALCISSLKETVSILFRENRLKIFIC